MALEQQLYQDLQSLLRRSAAHTRKAAGKLAEQLGELENKPWDESFRSWIHEAKRAGQDPNDVGDQCWGDARIAAEKYYRPLMNADSVVLELGPGSGRYTRHLMPHCREMVLVDYSKFVCAWMEEYFRGKGTFRVVLARDYALDAVADASIDAIIANGVFEHIYLEGFYRYMVTFARVLKPGGRGCVNFNNILSSGGFQHFRDELPESMNKRSIFRFYHPQTVEKLCREAGLEVERIETSEHRFAFLTFRNAR